MRKGGLEPEPRSRKSARKQLVRPAQDATDLQKLSPRGTISEALTLKKALVPLRSPRAAATGRLVLESIARVSRRARRAKKSSRRRRLHLYGDSYHEVLIASQRQSCLSALHLCAKVRIEMIRLRAPDVWAVFPGPPVNALWLQTSAYRLLVEPFRELHNQRRLRRDL